MLIALLSLFIGALAVLLFLMTLGVTGVVKEKEKEKEKFKKLADAYSIVLDGVEGDLRQEANLRASDPFLATLLMDLAEARQKINEVK